MGTKEQRIELLKGMNQYVIDLGDEEAYDTWFTLGVPDEATDDDYECIAEDLALWVYVCKIFGDIVKEYDEQVSGSSPFSFGGARTCAAVVRAPKNHYTIPPRICQVKICTKFYTC